MRNKLIFLLSISSILGMTVTAHAAQEWLIGEGLILPSLAQGKSKCFGYIGKEPLPIKLTILDKMTLITDYKSAQSSIGIEASTNFSFAGFSGGASLGMSSKIATSGNEIGFSYYATKIGLQTAAKSQIGLTDMGRKYFLAYANANGDGLLDAASELIRQCGANIIMSEKRGASYQIMAKLSSSYASSVKELAASAQGSSSFIEVSSKFNSAQSNTNQAFALNIERQSSGQDLNYPELSDAISQCALNEDGTINQSCKDIFSKYAGKILDHIQDLTLKILIHYYQCYVI